MVKKVYSTEMSISGLGKIPVRFTLAVAKGSTAVFKLGEDVEKFSGLKLEEARRYSDTPDSAYIFGLVNLMNGGKDVYYYINASRMEGRIEKLGDDDEAYVERHGYELVNLAEILFARWKNGKGPDWWAMKWPCFGGDCEITMQHVAEMVGKLGVLMMEDYMKMHDKVMGKEG